MWITVAKRYNTDDEPWLVMEKANVHTMGWKYTGYHHMDSYVPELKTTVKNFAALLR